MKKSNGISAIIGTAIALTIVFAIVIPLFLYMQSLQSLFMQEANRRLQYELERLNEKLEVYTTICGGWGTSELEVCIVIFNPGILSVAVPSIYGESYRYGLIKEDKNLLIIPGEKRIVKLDKIAFNPNVNDTLKIKLITLRGNSFVSKNIIGPRQLPYILAAAVKNMTVGYRYEVEVRMVGVYGCISEEVNQQCGTEAKHEFIPQTFTDKDGIAVFMVAPGNYTITLRVYDFYSNNEIITFETPYLEILDDTVVRLDATHQVPSLIPIPVRVSLPLIRNTVIIMDNDTSQVAIPYIISLGNRSEPLRSVKIRITITLEGLNTYQGLLEEVRISRIIPSESIVKYFTIAVEDDAVINKQVDPSKLGGRILYTISILGAKGEYTGTEYSLQDFEKPLEEGSITLCRLYTQQDRKSSPQPYQLVCETPQ